MRASCWRWLGPSLTLPVRGNAHRAGTLSMIQRSTARAGRRSRPRRRGPRHRAGRSARPRRRQARVQALHPAGELAPSAAAHRWRRAARRAVAQRGVGSRLLRRIRDAPVERAPHRPNQLGDRDRPIEVAIDGDARRRVPLVEQQVDAYHQLFNRDRAVLAAVARTGNGSGRLGSRWGGCSSSDICSLSLQLISGGVDGLA